MSQNKETLLPSQGPRNPRDRRGGAIVPGPPSSSSDDGPSGGLKTSSPPEAIIVDESPQQTPVEGNKKEQINVALYEKQEGNHVTTFYYEMISATQWKQIGKNPRRLQSINHGEEDNYISRMIKPGRYKKEKISSKIRAELANHEKHPWVSSPEAREFYKEEIKRLRDGGAEIESDTFVPQSVREKKEETEKEIQEIEDASTSVAEAKLMLILQTMYKQIEEEVVETYEERYENVKNKRIGEACVRRLVELVEEQEELKDSARALNEDWEREWSKWDKIVEKVEDEKKTLKKKLKSVQQKLQQQQQQPKLATSDAGVQMEQEETRGPPPRSTGALPGPGERTSSMEVEVESGSCMQEIMREIKLLHQRLECIEERVGGSPPQPSVPKEPRMRQPPPAPPGETWATVVSRRGPKEAEQRTREPAPAPLGETWVAVTSRRKRKPKEVGEGPIGGLNGGPPPAPLLPPKPKTRREINLSSAKRGLPRGAAVWIQASGDASTTEAIALARRKISLEELGVPAVRVRGARSGGILLEIGGSGSLAKAQALARRMEEALEGREGIRITCPSRRYTVKVTGIDRSVTTDEIAEALAEVGGCTKEEVAISNLILTRGRTCVAWAECPAHAAVKAAEATGVRVGWALARVEVLQRKPPLCFRCLARGHRQQLCPSPVVRTGCCLNCGQEGHKVELCGNAPHCPICEGRGGPADHRPGAGVCPPVPPREASSTPPRVERATIEVPPHGSGSPKVPRESVTDSSMDWESTARGSKRRAGDVTPDPPPTEEAAPAPLPQRPKRETRGEGGRLGPNRDHQ